MTSARRQGRSRALAHRTDGHELRNGQRRKPNHGLPDVFQEMLTEAGSYDASAAETETHDRPLKRRRVLNNDTVAQEKGSRAMKPSTTSKSKAPDLHRGDDPLITYSRHSDEGAIGSGDAGVSGDSEDSEVEWEEVDIQQDSSSLASTTDSEGESEIKDVNVVIDEKHMCTSAPKRMIRKGITKAEKKRRLNIHKMHVLCLLYNTYVRNNWCNDREIQIILKQYLSPRIIKLLNPNPDLSQTQAAQDFMTGVHHVKMLWNNKFAVNAYGLKRPRWAVNDEETKHFTLSEFADPPMSLAILRKAAKETSGSQDIGAQLLCSLFRAAGVDVRLVCSLQCLPFTAVAAGGKLPANGPKNTIYLDSTGRQLAMNDQNLAFKWSQHQTPTSTPARIKRISNIGRGGGAGMPSVIDKGKAPQVQLPQYKPKIRPAYPVFWVEVFNTPHQKWVSVDPLATFTVEKPLKLEPPLGHEENALLYAVAFEEDGTAKDVTRRYAKAYNAKTRKSRVESSEEGERWWKKSLKFFRRHNSLDRDRWEDAGLARKEAAEGLPKNIQDFKNHALYVLERHLRYNEVIHPMNEVGKVNIGAATSNNLESVYRRRDVHVVRSADKWYRLGREIKLGEAPLKHAPPRRIHGQSTNDADESDTESRGIGLYAAYQTELYIPPPVVRGRVPKNAFGNLDIYVPSMIPAGGAHIPHKEASKAARVVGVDYADAVTGFQFKGRHGTPIIHGCVVAKEYVEAVCAVIEGVAYMKEEAEDTARRLEALRLWKRFLTGLKIVERVNAYADEEKLRDVQNELNDAEKIHRDDYMEGGGGFFADSDAEIAMPTAQKPHTLDPEDMEELGNGFLLEEEDDYYDDEYDVERDGHVTEHTEPEGKNHDETTERSVHDETADEYEFTGPSLQFGTSEPSIFGSALLSQTQELLMSNPAKGGPNTTRLMYKAPKLSIDLDEEENPDIINRLSMTGRTSTKPVSEDTPLMAVGVKTPLIETAAEVRDTTSTGDQPTSHVQALETVSSAHVPNEHSAKISGMYEKDIVDDELGDDQSSLASHDPEDEDAEPEWLLSD